MLDRGVQKYPKPKTRIENPIRESNFRVPEAKYLIFLVRVPEPIIFLGLLVRVQIELFTQTGTRYPKFFPILSEISEIGWINT